MPSIRSTEPGATARGVARALTLLLIVAAPLALGTVHSGFYPPFLLLAFFAGCLSWAASWRARARGLEPPAVPGARLLTVLSFVVLLQLMPSRRVCCGW